MRANVRQFPARNGLMIAIDEAQSTRRKARRRRLASGISNARKCPLLDAPRKSSGAASKAAPACCSSWFGAMDHRSDELRITRHRHRRHRERAKLVLGRDKALLRVERLVPGD